jgi:hypothetical protein
MHQWPATLGRHDQRLGRCLPFFQVLLGLRKLQDVISPILQRDELATAGQRDWIFKDRFQPYQANASAGCQSRRTSAPLWPQAWQVKHGSISESRHVIRPSVAADRSPMAACVLRAIDQETANPRSAHLGEGAAGFFDQRRTELRAPKVLIRRELTCRLCRLRNVPT